MKNDYSISFRGYFLSLLFGCIAACSFAQVDFELSKYISVEFPVKPTATNQDVLYSFTHQSDYGVMSAVVAPAITTKNESMIKLCEGALDGLRKKAVSFESKKSTRNHCTIYTANYELINETNDSLATETIILYFREALFLISYSTSDPDNPDAQAEKDHFLSSLTIHNQDGAISQLDAVAEDQFTPTTDSSSSSAEALGELIGYIALIAIGGSLLYHFRKKLF